MNQDGTLSKNEREEIVRRFQQGTSVAALSNLFQMSDEEIQDVIREESEPPREIELETFNGGKSYYFYADYFFSEAIQGEVFVGMPLRLITQEECFYFIVRIQPHYLAYRGETVKEVLGLFSVNQESSDLIINMVRTNQTDFIGNMSDVLNDDAIDEFKEELSRCRNELPFID